MEQDIFVRVGDAPDAPGFQIWIVAIDNPKAAEQRVREAVRPGKEVVALPDRPNPETVERLGLAPGQAWCL
jgi:hypothetical protein